MRLRLFAVVVSLSIIGTVAAPRCRAADPENPFKKVAVGDWAAYKCANTGPTGDQPLNLSDGRWRLTVSAKDDKEVSLADNSPPAPGAPPIPAVKIDLTQPYDPTVMIANMISGLFNVTPSEEKTKELPKETITVGKTKYECKVVLITRTYTVAAKKATGTCEYKLWTCPDAPLSGVVKMTGDYSDNFGNARHAIIILHDSGKKE